MSLLQKASIITTPTAYAEDYLYSIKPAYALGSELVTNGTFDTDSNWTKGAGWTISGGVASCSGGSANLTQSVSATVGTTYRVSFTITAYNSGAIRTTCNTISSQDYNSVGTFVNFFKITSITSGQILLDPRGTFDGSIDNVSVKQVTDADFDFDRNSTGTRVNEDYLIEDVPYNLLTYSEEIKSTNSWIIQSGVTVTNNDVLAPNGTFTADKLVGNGTVGVFKQVTNLDGVVTRSVYLKSVTGNVSVIIKDPILTQTQKTLNLNETWQRYTLTEDNLSANNIQGIWIDDIPASGIYMWGAQVVKGDQPKDYLKTTDRLDIPRIDYTNGEPSILLEPSRTNLVTYSQDFSNAVWVKTGSSITSSTGLSPESLQNSKIIESIAGTAFISHNTVSITIGNTYTYSVFVKKINAQFIRLGHQSSSATGCWFDLDSGSVLTVNSENATIQKFPNGWYRITNTFVAITAGSGSSLAFIGICDADGSTSSPTGFKYEIYGAQLEAGSYATSLIHTSGSAVTRSADVATNAGNSDLINNVEGTLYVEAKAINNIATNFDRLATLSDGASGDSNVVRLEVNPTTQDRINWAVRVGGSTLASGNITGNDITQQNKYALSYKSGDTKFFVNGRLISTSTSTFTLPTLDRLNLSNAVGTNGLLGNAKSVMVFKEALTDLELEKLTGYNNHELYMNYYNRLSYLGLAEEYNVESDINNYIL